MADKMRRVTVRDPLIRLGQIVEAARLAKINPKNRKPYEVAPASRDAKVARATWEAVEAGSRPARASTYAQIETFFGWEAGCIRRYLEDDGPEPGPALVVSDVGKTPGRTLVVHYEGHELSEEDRQSIEALARRLARNGH